MGWARWGLGRRRGPPAVCSQLLTLPAAPSPQNGGECLRAYVSVALEQVARWHDEQGHNGLWYVMQVVSQLLDPRTSEFTAAFVGRLVSTLIAKAGRELGENLDQILRAVLSKMQQAETLSVMQVSGHFRGSLPRWGWQRHPGPKLLGAGRPQRGSGEMDLTGADQGLHSHCFLTAPPCRRAQSLIMVFAHLVHTQLEPLLEFLCSLPGPTGKPALEFVMAEWTSRQHLFYGQYEGKVRCACPRATLLPPPAPWTPVGSVHCPSCSRVPDSRMQCPTSVSQRSCSAETAPRL